jgi:hypothetical protein
MLCHVVFCTCPHQAAFLMLMSLLHARTHYPFYFLLTHVFYTLRVLVPKENLNLCTFDYSCFKP